MTTPQQAPAAAAIRLPRNKFLTPIVESLPGYAEAGARIEAADTYLRNMPAIPTYPAAGPVTEQWHAGEDEREAAIERQERHRKRTLTSKHMDIGQQNAALKSNVDHVLRTLNLHLLELQMKAAPEILINAGADTAAQAIKAGLAPEWQRIDQDIWPDYAELRDAQTAWHLQLAPQRYWVSARPLIDGEEPASLLHVWNLPEYWPDWRNRGRSRPRINIDGSTTRPEPWPTPTGAEFLLWAWKNHAELKIPTLRELDELFRARDSMPDVDDRHDDDDSEPFENSSRLLGPQLSRRRQQPAADHYNRTAPRIESRPRPAELQEVTAP